VRNAGPSLPSVRACRCASPRPLRSVVGPAGPSGARRVTAPVWRRSRSRWALWRLRAKHPLPRSVRRLTPLCPPRHPEGRMAPAAGPRGPTVVPGWQTACACPVGVRVHTASHAAARAWLSSGTTGVAWPGACPCVAQTRGAVCLAAEQGQPAGEARRCSRVPRVLTRRTGRRPLPDEAPAGGVPDGWCEGRARRRSAVHAPHLTRHWS
jgi:hypothetical protein